MVLPNSPNPICSELIPGSAQGARDRAMRTKTASGHQGAVLVRSLRVGWRPASRTTSQEAMEGPTVQSVRSKKHCKHRQLIGARHADGWARRPPLDLLFLCDNVTIYVKAAVERRVWCLLSGSDFSRARPLSIPSCGGHRETPCSLESRGLLTRHGTGLLAPQDAL
jgi:hypothetical protein